LNNPRSIFWHDYETWGAQARKDRPCQFAGIRTDEELNIIDDPVVMYCKPTPDYLPHPEACLVTGISPEKALDEGVTEAEFCASIAEQFMQPNTCVSGYNSIRFDDEVSRHLLYRNFYDPYEREWKNGNTRWDIIDLVRMTHALRPDGIIWPKKEDGRPSFRLEELTAANGIAHEGAHDALADVIATIEMAKLVKQSQPRLYDWLYTLRNKNKAKPLLDLAGRDMLVHVSGMFPATRGCMALVVPLAMHPLNQNGVIVYDVSQDPAAWMSLDAEEIRRRVFTRSDQMEAGVERVALKTIHVNKCPALAPLSVLDESTIERYGIDIATCEANREMLLRDARLPGKIREVFTEPEVEASGDPDHMLYGGGFFSDQDKQLMAEVRSGNDETLTGMALPFQDKRLPEMLFRYRARNFPGSLDAEETRRWQGWCREQLERNPNGVGLSVMEYFQALDKLVIEQPEHRSLLDSLRAYGEHLWEEVGAKS